MAFLILVPFDGGPAARAALRAGCGEARRDGSLVAALYVALVPRQLPLTADLPWLAREVTRVQLVAEPIVRESGATAWTEWVCARAVAPAIAGVAAELQASQILLGLRQPIAGPGRLRPWSLPARLRRLAPCPVVVRTFPTDWPADTRISSEALS